MSYSMPWYFCLPFVGIFLGLICGFWANRVEQRAEDKHRATVAARAAAKKRENAYAAGPIAQAAKIQLYDIAWQVGATGSGGPATASFSATVPRQFKF